MKKLLLFLLTPLCIISMDAPLPRARNPVTDADLEAFRADWKKEAAERAQAKKAQDSSTDKAKNSFNPPPLHTVTTDASLSSSKTLDKIPLFKAVIDAGMETPKTSFDSPENPFECDRKLISFLDDIRCGMIKIENECNQVCLRFRDHTSNTVLYTTNLPQAQNAVRYATVFGQMIHVKKLKNELARAQVSQQTKKPGEYPGLPWRITELSKQIENLEESLSKVHTFPDLSVYPDTELFTSQNNAKDSVDIQTKLKIALAKLAEFKKSENNLCRISLDRFYSFWAQEDLQYKQTSNDANRDLVQIQKNRTLFFQALEDGNAPQLLTIPATAIIKKASRSTIAFINRLVFELEHYDDSKNDSPHNSDEEIW